MTKHKFTDEEIKKALECCGSNHHTEEKYACKNCPLNGRSFDEGSCYDEALHDLALSLINRQQAKIANLEIELKAMRGAANSYKAEVERLEEQIADYELDEELRWEREVLCDDR